MSSTIASISPTTIADPLVENLSALWATDPQLARQMDAIADADCLVLSGTRSGHFTASVTTASDRSVALCSRYDPIDEAAKLVSRVPDERYELFVMGMGLGYHVGKLVERFADATVWVFEPDLRVIRAALACVDLSEAMLEMRVRIITTLDKSKCFADWTPHLAGISVGHAIVDHPASVQRQPDFFETARGLVDAFLAFGKTTINTLLVNSKRTCENLAANIPWYVASPGVGHLKNAMKGQPAIIVSAGPSLRKNKHLLPSALGHAVIISVQTAFQQLLDIGVEPHFVTSLDYHDICTQFFQHVPKHVRTELVAEPKATTKIFELNPGPVSLLGSPFVESLLKEMKLDRPRLPAGATVAHLAFYLAEYLGCDPIIFVGQDLGFSEGLAYAPGTSYDDLWRPELSRFNTVEMMQWQRIVRDRAILRKVPDYQGRPTYTEERLYTYLQQFERDFLASDRTIIDATEGGVAKRGTTVMSLDQAIARYCQKPLLKMASVHPGLRWDHIHDARASLGKRREEAITVQSISEQTMALLHQMRDSLEDQSRVNALIAKIDPLRSQMNALGEIYDLITQLTQQSELDRYAADRRIKAAGVSGVEKQRRQLDRDIANVEHMVRAAGEFVTLMDRCIEITSHCRGGRR